MASLNSQIKRLEKKLDGYQKESRLAQARTLNDLSRKSKNKVAKTVSAEVSVKQAILKKQIFTSRATSSSVSALVKSYVRPISAVRLLSKGQLAKAPRGTNRKGVRVAGKQFDGAFINRGRVNGRLKVMKREGRFRYPLVVISIRIDSSFAANQLPIAKSIMRSDFARIYERELKFRASKYGR